MAEGGFPTIRTNARVNLSGPPEKRRAQNKAAAIRTGRDLVDMLDGWSPASDEPSRRSIRFRYSDHRLDTHCHDEAIPWSWLFPPDTGGDMRAAEARLPEVLRVLLRSTSQHKRAPLRNLTRAAVETWDAVRLARTVRAVCAHGSEAKDSRPSPDRGPPPVRRTLRPPATPPVTVIDGCPF